MKYEIIVGQEKLKKGNKVIGGYEPMSQVYEKGKAECLRRAQEEHPGVTWHKTAEFSEGEHCLYVSIESQ